ncbi:MAG TPA: NAD(P)H-dependent glycerol-3-phosphate dehydrogenase [Syntrophorhabdaceae bacterium]|nr:NAD(P)H-dependent glycerol-3-phosphate dehydrogenase [Syntrophorhabdaceae bacterium]
MSIAVIGAGAWGTSFAIHLVRTGRNALLWAYEQELPAILRQKRENTYYLPGYALPDALEFTDGLKDAVMQGDDIIITVPSFALRATVRQIAPEMRSKRILILTKGIETDTFLNMSEVVQQVLGCGPERIAVLSGPSFAKEVAEGSFTATVVASSDKELARYFQQLIHNENFRVYTTEDIKGVELGGALKNVMAIGAGIIEGLRFGTNTQAAFVTRALAEMKRLGKALGAKEPTFMGLSGIGDLILTCYGNLSRNRSFGLELTKGRAAQDIIESQRSVVEGYYTVNATYNLSKKMGIEMPIAEELFHILYEGKDIQASLKDLITREFKEEDY